MPAVFHRHANLLALLGLAGLLLLLGAAVMIWRLATGEPYSIGEPVPQPVPFSHKHHVGEDGIDCRYCHTSVESSAFAGLPPIETCMTCHSRLFNDAPLLRPVVDGLATGTPIHWNRVHTLPGFAYFDHSIHVNKGVGCATCHGPVDRMPLMWRVAPLTMGWCLDCHRAPEKYLRPRAKVFDMEWQPPPDQERLGKALATEYHVRIGKITDCSTCHR
jgi:hypothetical protein